MHPRRSLPALALIITLVSISGMINPPANANVIYPSSRASVYLPFITRPASVDLVLSEVEITQSVQNSSNTVPMVAGRPTVVRVYVTVSGAAELSGVVVEAAATRNGAPLPGSPRRSDPRTVATSASRGNYASSFNIALPAEWLSGNVQLSIVVDPDNRIAESNETNNRLTRTLEFLAVPPLDLTIVPIQYTHTPNGRTYPAPTRDTVSDWIMRAYPISGINVRLRAPVSFTGDLRSGSEWERLLNVITLVKQSDGAPSSRVYYGLVPIASGSDRWFSSGIAGIGWVGRRASVGLDLTSPADAAGQVAAHEIGHNLGRYHAPCGVSGDPRQPFPYADGSIGTDVYGLDISRARVWSPVAPDNTKDLMSYCQPQWVSDFTYQGLLNNQRIYGASVAPMGSGYLVRAVLEEDGSATLEPVYALDRVALDEPQSGEYTIELLDAAGTVLAAHATAAIEAEGPYYYGENPMHHDHNHDHSHRSIVATVPAPAGAVVRVRLLRDSVVIAERAIGSGTALATDVQATLALEGATWVLAWGNAAVPTLVRYTHDDAHWTTLGVDLVGGRLVIDPKTLPGGGQGQFEIVPSGGATLTVNGTPMVATHDAPPQAWIDGPVTLPVGAPLLLYGRASDREDGAAADISWSVNGVFVSAGQIVMLDNLAPGAYRVRLTARDSAGNEASAEHHVIVGRR
ncbi:MAG: M66 family metalloprotease [Roseiflexus sp.]|nr:M66 family metalloprotease [Roseiflexus sp.]MCS7290819.1 M66 family metalloprotease [Roseiflexus sp.]MDW8146881.1 CARDB domain-containing protein [Roseiflexaceae bacterium]MDW8233370.1 CARDB domain-containing protein [Roseiflexaceae bacterium]